MPLLIFKSLQFFKSENLAELHSSVYHSIVIEARQIKCAFLYYHHFLLLGRNTRTRRDSVGLRAASSPKSSQKQVMYEKNFSINFKSNNVLEY